MTRLRRNVRFARFLAQSLLLVLAFSLVASAQTVDLEMWSWTALSGIRYDTLKALVDRFNEEHDGIHINLTQKNTAQAELFPAVAAGAGPDLFNGSSSWIGAYSRVGIVANLDTYIERHEQGQAFFDDLHPGVLATIRPGGTTRALPYNLELYGIYSNPSVLNEAGVPSPQPGWNWDDLREFGSKLLVVDNEGRIARGAYGMASSLSTTWTFLGSAGGTLFDSEGRRSALLSDAAIEAFTFMDDLLRSNLLGPLGVEARSMFIGGRAGFFIDGSQRISLLRQEGMSALDVLPPVQGPRGHRHSTLAFIAMFITASTNPVKEEAAWKAVKYLTSPEAQAFYNAAVMGFPARLSSVNDPAYRSVLDQDDVMRAWVERVSPVASSAGYSGTPGDAEAGAVFAQEFTRFLTTLPPVRVYLEELDRTINLTLDRAWGAE